MLALDLFVTGVFQRYMLAILKRALRANLQGNLTRRLLGGVPMTLHIAILLHDHSFVPVQKLLASLVPLGPPLGLCRLDDVLGRFCVLALFLQDHSLREVALLLIDFIAMLTGNQSRPSTKRKLFWFLNLCSHSKRRSLQTPVPLLMCCQVR